MPRTGVAEKLLLSFKKAMERDCSPDSESPVVQLMTDERDKIIGILATCVEELAPKKKGRVRARSAYQCWKGNEEVKASFRKQHPGANGPETNRLMGEMWKALDAEGRAPFEAEHLAEKEQFAQNSDNESIDKATKSKTKQKKEKAVRKRARTAYQFFRGDDKIKAEMRLENPDAPFGKIAKLQKAKWEAMTLEEQAPWEEKAIQEREAFALEKDKMTSQTDSQTEPSGSPVCDALPNSQEIGSDEANSPKDLDEKELFVLGGGEVYAQLIDKCNKMYISHIQTDIVDADVYFPEVDWSKWEQISRKSFEQNERNEFPFDFTIYERK